MDQISQGQWMQVFRLCCVTIIMFYNLMKVRGEDGGLVSLILQKSLVLHFNSVNQLFWTNLDSSKKTIVIKVCWLNQYAVTKIIFILLTDLNLLDRENWLLPLLLFSMDRNYFCTICSCEVTRPQVHKVLVCLEWPSILYCRTGRQVFVFE